MPRAQSTSNTKTSSNGTGDAISHLLADLEKVRGEVSKLSETVVNATGKSASKIGDHGHRVAEDVGAIKDAGLQDASEHLTNLERRTVDAIRKNPVQAVGIAAAAGFLTALLTRK